MFGQRLENARRVPEASLRHESKALDDAFTYARRLARSTRVRAGDIVTQLDAQVIALCPRLALDLRVALERTLGARKDLRGQLALSGVKVRLRQEHVAARGVGSFALQADQDTSALCRLAGAAERVGEHERVGKRELPADRGALLHGVA